jgi:N-acetylneuraminic acid mutarotase
MASFISRGWDLPPTGTDFFTDDESSSHEDNINRIAAAGITTGLGGGIYQPLGLVSRAQMASFIARAIQWDEGGGTTSTSSTTSSTSTTTTTTMPGGLGSWATRAAMPQGTLDAGSDSLVGILYLFGGKTSNTNRLTTVRSYNPSNNSWGTKDQMPGAAREDPAVAAHNGLIYVFGGASANPFTADVTTAAEFTPGAAAGSQWDDATVADLPAPITSAAAISWEGLIWIVGGLDSSCHSVSTVRTYDPATDTYGTGPALPAGRDNVGLAILGGDLYVFGGRNRGGTCMTGTGDSLTTVWRLTTPGGSWQARAAMPAVRRSMVVGTANGDAQLFGGEATATPAISAVHEYDPGSNSWTTLTQMPTGRHGPAGATINGVTYVVGGATAAGANSATTVNEAFTR